MAFDPWAGWNPGPTITTHYGPEGNPNYPGTIAYKKKHGTYVDPAKKLEEMQKEYNLQAKERETEARKYLDEIIGMYQPGGTFGQGYETMLGRQKTQDVASGTQALVSSGMFNTTQTAGLGTKWEEQVGMPARAKLEDVRYGALSQALGQKAQFVTDIQQSPIDYAMLANLIAQGQSF